MNLFEINEDALRKAWSVEGKYWFSLADNTIEHIANLTQLDMPDMELGYENLKSEGYVPFVSVSNLEVMRAFTQTLSNKKLKEALEKINDDEFVEAFWKYHDIYPELRNAYNDFEDNYVIEKTKKWCEENAIKYSL